MSTGWQIAFAVVCGVLVLVALVAAIARAHRTARTCCALAVAVLVSGYLVVLVR